jgi:hypothetical protein
VAAPQYPGKQGACVSIKWSYTQRNSLAQNTINSKNSSDLSDIYGQATEQIEIIGFQDEGSIEEMQAPVQNTKIPTSMVMASTKENKTHTIPGFLGRLYEIDNFQWTATSPAGTVLKQYRFPDVLLAQPALSRKAYNFFGLRAGVEFVVLVNKQKFQQGNLMISHLPGAKYNDAKNAMCQTTTPTASSANLATLSGMPRVNLDLMDATKAVLRAPYASPFVYYNLLSGAGTIGDFYITVYSPLQDIAASGTVSVQVMARFIDVDLQFPAGNSLASFSKTPKVENFYNEFVQKPDLVTLSNLVREGTAIMEQVRTGNFRFQMNSETVSTQNFKPRALPNMAVSDESNNAHLLSISAKNTLPSINMGEASTLEHDFMKIVQIPVYNSRFNITSSQAAGTNVWSKQVTLLDYTNTAPDGSIGVDYLTYVGQNFSKWRSSFKFNFRFVKTQFHSLRVRIFFAPNTNTVVGVDRNAVISKIVDLEVNNFVEFEVPFIWPHPFLNNETTLPYSLGMIGVDVLTRMVHPETVKNTIEVIVERAAGTDFDVNLPRQISYFPYDPRVEEDNTATVSVSQPEEPLSQVVPLESGERIRVYTLDPVDSNFMKTMQALPEDIKSIISANSDRFNQSVVGALNDLAAEGHKITQATIRLPLPKILAKHDELRRKKKDVKEGDWVKDLTEEGVEPNPGPVTYQGWSLAYIVDSFTSGNTFSLTIPNGTWRCYYNYSTDTGGTGFTGTTLATPWGNVAHIAYDAVPCAGYVDLVADGATSVSFTITKTSAADNNFRVAFTLCGNPIPTVSLAGVPSVSISNEPISVSVSGTPNVSVTNTPNVHINNSSVPTVAIDQPLQVINVSRSMVDDFKFQMNSEQDDYRMGYDDTSYVRPINSIQADRMSLGGKIGKIDDMIHRSTVYSSLTTTNSDDIYFQPHMIGVARKNASNVQLYGPTDGISYWANLFAFARGGVNTRVASSPDFAYTVILDPDSTTLSSIDTEPLGQVASPTGSALQRKQSVNIQQVIKPSLEGYGEWSTPFYSDTFMYYVNPVLNQSPSLAALNMQCPYTTTIVRPNGAFTQFTVYRAACKDFEFSYLTGPPRVSSIV